MKTERELFEAWAYSKKWNIFRVRDMGIDRYVDDFVDGAWSGWKASASREGYKLVPVEIADAIDWHTKHRKYGRIFPSCHHAE